MLLLEGDPDRCAHEGPRVLMGLEEHGQHLTSTAVALGCMGFVAELIAQAVIAVIHQGKRRAPDLRNVCSAPFTVSFTGTGLPQFIAACTWARPSTPGILGKEVACPET